MEEFRKNMHTFSKEDKQEVWATLNSSTLRKFDDLLLRVLIKGEAHKNKSTWFPHLGTKRILGQLYDNGTNHQKALMMQRPMRQLRCNKDAVH